MECSYHRLYKRWSVLAPGLKLCPEIGRLGLTRPCLLQDKRLWRRRLNLTRLLDLMVNSRGWGAGDDHKVDSGKESRPRLRMFWFSESLRDVKLQRHAGRLDQSKLTT
ncbi:hypothetical protein ElyMa_001178000 [Elysia marginata]|uniref:Uncharacterized protein n=1 Tax=Elysia marginata TaxID=1093978 RepID=A0AAV4I1T6_9GAST|nr:hypothetical protein ElyMa_001178000 [Elysia marginata]